MFRLQQLAQQNKVGSVCGRGRGRCGVKANGNANVIEQLQRQQEQWHATCSRQQAAGSSLSCTLSGKEREGELAGAGTVVEGRGLRLLKSAG